jgi:hypothetical protein
MYPIDPNLDRIAENRYRLSGRKPKTKPASETDT